MSQKSKSTYVYKPKDDVLHHCSKCKKGYPAIKRFWNRKILCSACAQPSFQKWIRTVGTVCLIGVLIMAFLIKN